MNIETVIKKGLCLGCGVCSQDPNIQKLKFVEKYGLELPVIRNKDHGLADLICPGVGYDINRISKNIYNCDYHCLELGHYNSLYAAHSNDSRILKNASSGGVVTELLLHLLKEQLVKYVGVTKFIYTPKGLSTQTLLTNKMSDLIKAQGSKYCPVNIDNFLKQVKETDCTVAFVGTPCQVAGIRKLQEIEPIFKKRIKFTISNFCGGFKNYNQILKLAKRHNIDYNSLSFFRFRGGGQPGSLLMTDLKGAKFEASYPRYVGYTGFSKLLRCHLCVDATGELADICCGDAWLDKYENDKYPRSIILTRTSLGDKLIKQMEFNKRLNIESLTEEEVITSQKINITSKKYRQHSRYSLYKFLGYTIPIFDGGWRESSTKMSTEILVFSKHIFKQILERFGLYKYFRILIRRSY